MTSNPTLEGKIREMSGIGNFSPACIPWLHEFVKAFFNVPYSFLTLYLDNGQLTVYLIPSNHPASAPALAQPLDKDAFTNTQINGMTRTKAEKMLRYTLNMPECKIKIVRELPVKVKKAENVKRMAKQSTGHTIP